MLVTSSPLTTAWLYVIGHYRLGSTVYFETEKSRRKGTVIAYREGAILVSYHP